MNPIVSIIMGSTSDLPVMEKAAQLLNDFEIPFEMNALSAHRTPEEVEHFAKNAEGRGLKVIIAAAGMAAHLPGVIAASTPLPVIGVPLSFISYGGSSLVVSMLALGLALSVYDEGVKQELEEERQREESQLSPHQRRRDLRLVSDRWRR